jgi:DNA-directed RNA polymerase specialized sigma24 family protein
MASEGTVTQILVRIKEGDPAAAQQLWESYFEKLVALARARLQAKVRRVSDEEDVALSVFESFCRRAGEGQYPKLQDRDDLWQLLFVMTVRKSINLARREGTKSRGGGRVQTFSDLEGLELDLVREADPTPALAAQVVEECQRLLKLLGDETLRSVALWKMEGFTIAEIAARLGCVDQTVKRKLRVIRQLWAEETAAAADTEAG